MMLAPVRERGLKCKPADVVFTLDDRSREGAWIEIRTSDTVNMNMLFAPVRERGLKFLHQLYLFLKLFAPVRERGLK